MTDVSVDEESSSEERIQWLRDRGVLIEIPGERVSKSKQPIISHERVDISVVKIPCNINEPYKEISVQCFKDNGDNSKYVRIYWSNIHT